MKNLSRHNSIFIRNERASPGLEMIFIAPIMLAFILILIDVYHYFRALNRLQTIHHNTLNLIKNTTRYYTDSICIYGLNSLTNNEQSLDSSNVEDIIMSFAEIGIQKTYFDATYLANEPDLQAPKLFDNLFGYTINRGVFGNFSYHKGGRINCLTENANDYNLTTTNPNLLLRRETGGSPYRAALYHFGLKHFTPISYNNLVYASSRNFTYKQSPQALSDAIRDINNNTGNIDTLKKYVFDTMDLGFILYIQDGRSVKVPSGATLNSRYTTTRRDLDLTLLDLALELPFYKLATLDNSPNLPDATIHPQRISTTKHFNLFSPSNDDAPYDQLYVHKSIDVMEVVGKDEGTFIVFSSLIGVRSVIGDAVRFISGYTIPKIYIKDNNIIFKKIEPAITDFCPTTHANRNSSTVTICTDTVN